MRDSTQVQVSITALAGSPWVSCCPNLNQQAGRCGTWVRRTRRLKGSPQPGGAWVRRCPTGKPRRGPRVCRTRGWRPAVERFAAARRCLGSPQPSRGVLRHSVGAQRLPSVRVELGSPAHPRFLGLPHPRPLQPAVLGFTAAQGTMRHATLHKRAPSWAARRPQAESKDSLRAAEGGNPQVGDGRPRR